MHARTVSRHFDVWRCYRIDITADNGLSLCETFITKHRALLLWVPLLFFNVTPFFSCAPPTQERRKQYGIPKKRSSPWWNLIRRRVTNVIKFWIRQYPGEGPFPRDYFCNWSRYHAWVDVRDVAVYGLMDEILWNDVFLRSGQAAINRVRYS